MDWNGDARGEFEAIDEVGSLIHLIAAVYHAGEGVKTEIDGCVFPGSLFHGSKAGFGQIAKGYAGGGDGGGKAGGRGSGGGERGKTFVVDTRGIQAEGSVMSE